MRKRFSRRDFLKFSSKALAATAVVGLGACAPASPSAPQAPSDSSQSGGKTDVPSKGDEALTIRMSWFGAEARHKMYNTLLDKYQDENPNVTIEREFADWTPYFDKFNTQVAGGNVPDIIHLINTNFFPYANRGVLLPLDNLIASNKIDLSAFPKEVIDSGIGPDGKVYVISLGNSAPSLMYNETYMKEINAELPKPTWTWVDFIAAAKETQPNLPEGVYYSSDWGGGDGQVMTFMHQRGKALFKDGKIGFEKEDMKDWLMIWEELRKAGAIPPAEVHAEKGGLPHQDHMFVKRQNVVHFQNGNQLKLYQKFTEDELSLDLPPRGEQNGDWIIGGYIAISAKSKNVDTSADVINWMVNDPEAAKIYNAEHGVPGNVTMRDVIKPQLGPSDHKLIDYMEKVTPVSVPPDVRPDNQSEIIKAFTLAYNELAFGRLTVDQAVEQFFNELEVLQG